MNYFLALATMFVVFVVPVIILVGIVGAPIERGRPARRDGTAEEGERRTLPGGSVH